MAGPPLGQQVTELKGELREMAAELTRFKEVAEFARKVSDDKVAEVDLLAKKLQEKVADAVAKLAAIEERIKAFEKGADRRWQLAPILISAGGVLISAGGVVVAILIALSKK
jgi:hypothetical protein